MRNIIILFLISTNLFSQVIVVHSKKDPRLLAYRDSVKYYLYGLKAVNTAKRINRNDAVSGKLAYDMLIKYELDNNIDVKKIKPVSCRRDLSVIFKVGIYDKQEQKIVGDKIIITTYRIDSIWYPDVYKKPVCKVIYEPIRLAKADTTKTSKHIFIYTLNGQTVNREQFEKVYGRKTKT